MRLPRAAATVLILFAPVLPAKVDGQQSNAPRTETQTTDEAAVRAALQHYLDGHATGLGAHFDSVFHERANLYWIADGAVQTRTGEAYIAGASGRPAANESERRRRITWVEVTGSTAVARIDLDYPGAWFTDYMSLLKVDGEWRIVNKIFHIDRSGEPSSSGGPRPEGRQDDAAQQEQDVFAAMDGVYERFTRAYLLGEPDSVVVLYTDDPLYLPGQGPVLEGRDVLRSQFRFLETIRAQGSTAHISFESKGRGTSGDQAWDVGYYTLEVEDAAGRRGPPGRGKFTTVWQRDATGQWRIHVDGFSPAPPAQR